MRKGPPHSSRCRDKSLTCRRKLCFCESVCPLPIPQLLQPRAFTLIAMPCVALHNAHSYVQAMVSPLPARGSRQKAHPCRHKLAAFSSAAEWLPLCL